MPVKKPEGHIPRPSNAFFIYRKEKMNQIHAMGGEHFTQSQYSKVIGLMWKCESAEVKARYYALAKQEVEEHREKYPGWSYKPAKRQRKQAGNVLEHEGTRASSAQHAVQAAADYLPAPLPQDPCSPPSLPGLASSSGSSSSAQTSPGLSTPSPAFSQPEPSSTYDPQTSPQEITMEAYHHIMTMARHQLAADGAHAYQQTMLQDRAYAGQHTVGSTMGPGPTRQQPPRTTADRGLPYARPNASNARSQRPGRRRAALPPLGHPEHRASPVVAHGFPAQNMPRRTGAPPFSQAAPGPALRWNSELAPLDTGFYDFAAPPQVNAAPAIPQLAQVQPQAPPAGSFDIQPFNFPSRHGASRSQAEPSASSSSTSARPRRAPAMDAFPEWNAPGIASSGISAQRSPFHGGARVEGTNDPAPAGSAAAGDFLQPGSASFNASPSGAMAFAPDVPLSFDTNLPSIASATSSEASRYDAVQQSSGGPSGGRYASSAREQHVGGGGSNQASRHMTRPLSVTDVSPPSGSYNPLEALPEDAIWPNGMSLKSPEELDSWFTFPPENA